jgi:hypothetical protein
MKIVFWVSNMWQDILKIQVLDTTTGLSTINEPMVEDDNCCELAREKFLEEQANYYDSLPAHPHRDSRENWIRYFEEMLAMTDCKTFREVLQDVENRYIKRQNSFKQLKSSIPFSNTLRFWEECEK